MRRRQAEQLATQPTQLAGLIPLTCLILPCTGSELTLPGEMYDWTAHFASTYTGSESMLPEDGFASSY